MAEKVTATDHMESSRESYGCSRLMLTAQFAIICAFCNGSDGVDWKCLHCDDILCKRCKDKHVKKHFITERKREKMYCRQPCSHCSDNIDVIWQCRDCKLNLCEKCVIKHLSKRNRNNHVIRKNPRNISGPLTNIETTKKEDMRSFLGNKSDTSKVKRNELMNTNTTKAKKDTLEPFTRRQLFRRNDSPVRNGACTPLCISFMVELYHLMTENYDIDKGVTRFIPVIPQEATLCKSSKMSIHGKMKCYSHPWSDCTFICRDCEESGCILCFDCGMHITCRKIGVGFTKTTYKALKEDNEKCLQILHICASKLTKLRSFFENTVVDDQIVKAHFAMNKTMLLKKLQEDLFKIENEMFEIRQKQMKFSPCEEGGNDAVRMYYFELARKDSTNFEILRLGVKDLLNLPVDALMESMRDMQERIFGKYSYRNRRDRELREIILPSFVVQDKSESESMIPEKFATAIQMLQRKCREKKHLVLVLASLISLAVAFFVIQV